MRWISSTVLDFETDPSFDLTVTVDDSSVGAIPDAQVSQSFNTTDVNEALVIGNLDADTLSYVEGGGALVIDQGGDASVFDSDSTNFDTGMLTVSIPSGGDAKQDVLAIQNQGTGTGQIGLSGANVTLRALSSAPTLVAQREPISLSRSPAPPPRSQQPKRWCVRLPTRTSMPSTPRPGTVQPTSRSPMVMAERRLSPPRLLA
jgi:hypothetical protein